MLQVFYLDVAYILQWFPSAFHVFLQVFQMNVSSGSSAFKYMLQLLHLNVLKVDRVLYLLLRFLLPSSVFAPPLDAGSASVAPFPFS